MLDRSAAESPGRAAASVSRAPARSRRRALLACAVAALALHAAFIGNIGGPEPGEAGTAVAPMLLRTLPDAAPARTMAESPAAVVVQATVAEGTAHEPVEAMVEVAVAAAPAVPRPAPAPRAARVPRQAGEAVPASRQSQVAPQSQASTNSGPENALTSAMAASDPPRAAGAVVSIPAEAGTAAAAAAAVDEPPLPAGRKAGAARPPLLAPGDEPPPLYRTRLPPSLTLHYQVRRAGLRGTGQIRWTAAGDHYRLALEAQVAGLTLLIQTSEGAIGPDGLAPLRFLDRRARRSAQAANFRRDDGRITFSGTAIEWPLLGGSQDRLSWMIQLAGIAAAEPGLLVDGGRITMAVIGARGDAAIWAFDWVGHETIETVRGSVHAVKLVRAGRFAYDTTAEIWLDPERSYLPVHATLRNGDGAPEYDLLLERVEPD